MAHQVVWTTKVLKSFEELANLTEEECYIMESRCKNVTVTSQALHLHCSEARVHKMISNLKKKYDVVQKEHPDVFPVRKKSQKEKYMDEN